jgi:DNA-binding winged helix-turn-helix (wHTH) protein
MNETEPARRYRFGAFEADEASGELRRQGIRVKINAQPFQVLLMLLERSGEVLTREEISRTLWPDDTFVDFEHGVNSAVNRIREALGDAANNPRYVETLARRGYRFVAPVQKIQPVPEPRRDQFVAPDLPQAVHEERHKPANGFLATPEELPATSHAIVRLLYLGLQLMYVGFYIGALMNLGEIEDLLSPLPQSTLIFYFLVGTAAILIPVRAFTFFAVLFRAPRIQQKFLTIWPYLLIADVLWALSPFLLLNHINIGLALACMALLVYSPFAQRSLMLMGADCEKREFPTAAR